MFVAFTADQERLRVDLRSYLAGLLDDETRHALRADVGPTTRRLAERMGADRRLGLGWPPEWGGHGLGPVEQHIFYVVNGRKSWMSYYDLADVCWLAVRTDPGAERHSGITVLLVPMDSPGVTVTPTHVLNDRHPVASVFFDDVRVPVGNVVGGVGNGWRVITTALNHERITLGVPGEVAGLFNAVRDQGLRHRVAARRTPAADGGRGPRVVPAHRIRRRVPRRRARPDAQPQDHQHLRWRHERGAARADRGLRARSRPAGAARGGQQVVAAAVHLHGGAGAGQQLHRIGDLMRTLPGEVV